MANSKPRRRRPKSKQDRARLCELNRQLNGRGLADDRRAELEAERDRLSPVVRPPTREDLEALIRRVEAAKEKGSPLGLSAKGERDSESGSSASPKPLVGEKGLDYWLAVMDKVEAEKVEFRRRYEAASPAERTRLFAERYPLTPPAEFPELAKRFRLPECDVKTESPDSVLRRLGRKFSLRDCDEPMQTKSELAQLSAPAPEPRPAVKMDLDAQVNLLLLVDPPLARLAAHAPEYDSGIRAALTRQLQEHGYADGVFLTELYNTSRPKNLSAFPPRRF